MKFSSLMIYAYSIGNMRDLVKLWLKENKNKEVIGMIDYSTKHILSNSEYKTLIYYKEFARGNEK